MVSWTCEEHVVSEAKNEREAVAEIFAKQDETVQQVIREVLRIERSRMHLRRQDKGMIDLLVNAVRGIVS
jgi:hypothetical protein